MLILILTAALLSACGQSAHDKAREKEEFERAVRVEAKRLVDEDLEKKYPQSGPTKIASPPATMPNEVEDIAAAVGQADYCWSDYCACDTDHPDYGGADVAICRNQKMGVPVDDGVYSAAATARDARKAMRDWKEENPGF